MEVEKAKEIHTSQNWAEVCAELDKWIAAEEAALRTCHPEHLRDVQLTIKMLEKMKKLPEIVIDREAL